MGKPGKCVVKTCANCVTIKKGPNDVPGLSYHRFPKDPIIRGKWANALNLTNEIITDGQQVCSAHFSDCDFDRTKPFLVRLKKDAIPSQFYEIKLENDEQNQIKAVENKFSHQILSVCLAKIVPDKENNKNSSKRSLSPIIDKNKRSLNMLEDGNGKIVRNQEVVEDNSSSNHNSQNMDQNQPMQQIIVRLEAVEPKLIPHLPEDVVFNKEQETSIRKYLQTFLSNTNYGLDDMGTRKLIYEIAVLNNLPIPHSWKQIEMASRDWLAGYQSRQHAAEESIE
ncbi:uncharacterized protein LOC122499567 [Leptopilina heterotoma]|uniref:uncharacterized protein LOC122499567 n=1 Tax=Leptopilina heterotoma TaxID=63436 RepID=UPI001CA8EB97|nr:uncharacterized protein LOC122499567 [Leptopilina heterotoma]